MGKTSFFGPHRSQIPVTDPRADFRVHYSGLGLQRHNVRGKGQKYSSQHVNAQNINNFTSTMPASQRNSPNSSLGQVSGPRYSFPNITPQQILYDGWDRPYLVTAVQTAPTASELIPRGRRTSTILRGAASPSNTAPAWSPRDPWNKNDFQPINHHTGSLSAYTSPGTYTNSQEAQLTSPNHLKGIPRIGDNHLRYADVGDPSMQAGLLYIETMQEIVPAMPDPSDMLLAGENENLFRDINFLPRQADFHQLGDSQEPPPAIPIDLSGMQGTGGIQTYHTDMDASIWQAELHSYENWLAPISTIPNDTSGVHSTGKSQESYPDRHALVGQAEFHSYENLLVPSSTIAGDFPGPLGMEGNQMHLPDLNIIPEQPASISEGNWPEPASEAPGDFSCTLGIEDYRNIIFPDTNAPETQGVYLPNGNLQEQGQGAGGLQNFSTLPGIENSRALQQKPTAVWPAGAVTYTDELWRNALATEPDGYEDFPSSGPADLTTVDEFEDVDATAPGSPSGAACVGDHQVSEHDADTFPEQLDLSTFEATSVNGQFSFLGTGRHRVADIHQETLSEQPIVTAGGDGEVTVPETDGFGDAPPTISLGILGLFGLDCDGWTDPDWESLSGAGASTAEDGLPDAGGEGGAAEGSPMRAEAVHRQPRGGNDGSDGELHEDG